MKLRNNGCFRDLSAIANHALSPQSGGGLNPRRTAGLTNNPDRAIDLVVNTIEAIAPTAF